jgi:hypothetical protein
MVWDPAIPATNADLLSAPVRDNFGALESALMAPLTAATDGYLLYRAAGPTVSGESNLLWDAANNNLKLFGGGVGTSGNGVLALGPSTTAPTTSPIDTVQLYTIDWDTSGRSLQIRDERGGFCTFGSDSGVGTTLHLLNRTQVVRTDLYSDNVGGGVGTFNNFPFFLWVNNGASGAAIQLRTDGHIAMALGGISGVRLVTNGAPDSGGLGYRLLVITN